MVELSSCFICTISLSLLPSEDVTVYLSLFITCVRLLNIQEKGGPLIQRALLQLKDLLLPVAVHLDGIPLLILFAVRTSTSHRDLAHHAVFQVAQFDHIYPYSIDMY